MNEKLNMATISIFKNIILCISFIFLFSNCEKSSEKTKSDKIDSEVQTSTNSAPDLSEAIRKRLEGKHKQAILLLLQLNEEYPNNPEIIVQMARALFEDKQFELAAFRFDQANSDQKTASLNKEAGLAYEYAEDFKTAIDRYKSFLAEEEDQEIWLRVARLHALLGENTLALNAFSKGSGSCSYDDCITMANLYFEKKLFQQSEHWFREASRMQEGVQAEPLIGMLRIKLLNQENEKAESLILAIEKNHPGILSETDLDKEAANLLRKRRLSEFIQGGISSSELSISELAAFLNNPPEPQNDQSVIALSKIPPATLLKESTEKEIISSVEQPQNSLASAFSLPLESESTTFNQLEKSRQAFLNRKYLDSLQLARSAIKDDPTNAEAWKLCAQAHFQLGETKEAEMTILEALRHDPNNLNIRMDYLRVARETLEPKRYLDELEKAREKFPDSVDLVWELARRYHLIERMPVTASILYNQVLDLTSSDSAIHKRAKIELLKLGEL